MTHTQRWHSKHKTIGFGHLYQGRYKSFPIETNRYLLQLFRYVERNALRAKLVKKQKIGSGQVYIEERRGILIKRNYYQNGLLIYLMIILN